MLGAFLRGQFLVMLILGVMYGVGLWLVGLDLGILIGLAAGLLTFVPYLGPTSGIVLGLVAALVQFGDGSTWPACWWCSASPDHRELRADAEARRRSHRPASDGGDLRGARGGQLFGFLGMLLALPVAAVANVLLRYAHEQYRASGLYAGEAPMIVTDATPAGHGPA